MYAGLHAQQPAWCGAQDSGFPRGQAGADFLLSPLALGADARCFSANTSQDQSVARW